MKITKNGILRINYRYIAINDNWFWEILHKAKEKFPSLVRILKRRGARDYTQSRPALKCNFNCSYCIFRWARRHPFSEEHFLQTKLVWDQLAQLEDRILVRISFDGETLIDKWAMECALYINKIPNVEICEFLTNNSVDPAAYLDRIDPRKTTFNCSFHPEKISFEKFLGHIDTLREAGCRAIANMVMTPQAVKNLPDLYQSFEEKNVRFRPCLLHGYYEGKVFPHDYTAQELDIIRKHSYSEFEFEYMAGKASKGLMCYAGVDMLNVFLDGSVKRCSFVKIGHIKDLVSGKVKLRKDPYPCPHDDCINYSHMMGLEDFREQYDLSEDFVDDYSLK